MDMSDLMELLKIIIPSGVVFLTAYFTIKNFLDAESKKNLLEVRKMNRSVVTPIRLQAYERVVMFLERISVDNLVIRIHGDQAKSAKQFHEDLLNSIRSEYEHNMSQQVYVSAKGWEAVKFAKEEMIKLVNLASTQMKDESTGLDLSKMVFEMADQLEEAPTKLALDLIKQEIKLIF